MNNKQTTALVPQMLFNSSCIPDPHQIALSCKDLTSWPTCVAYLVFWNCTSAEVVEDNWFISVSFLF